MGNTDLFEKNEIPGELPEEDSEKVLNSGEEAPEELSEEAEPIEQAEQAESAEQAEEAEPAEEAEEAAPAEEVEEAESELNRVKEEMSENLSNTR